MRSSEHISYRFGLAFVEGLVERCISNASQGCYSLTGHSQCVRVRSKWRADTMTALQNEKRMYGHPIGHPSAGYVTRLTARGLMQSHPLLGGARLPEHSQIPLPCPTVLPRMPHWIPLCGMSCCQGRLQASLSPPCCLSPPWILPSTPAPALTPWSPCITTFWTSTVIK